MHSKEDYESCKKVIQFVDYLLSSTMSILTSEQKGVGVMYYGGGSGPESQAYKHSINNFIGFVHRHTYLFREYSGGPRRSLRRNFHYRMCSSKIDALIYSHKALGFVMHKSMIIKTRLSLFRCRLHIFEDRSIISLALQKVETLVMFIVCLRFHIYEAINNVYVLHSRKSMFKKYKGVSRLLISK